MKNNVIIITVLVAIIAAGAGFFGGMQYQKSQRPAGGQFANRQFGQGSQGQFVRRNGQSGGAVIGQILSLDDKSITVKMPDGSSKIVILSEATAINKQAEGTKSDLKTGENVAVFGSANADGSVTAQNIQLNPMIRQFGGSVTPSPTK
jgi:ribosomal protein L2